MIILCLSPTHAHVKSLIIFEKKTEVLKAEESFRPFKINCLADKETRKRVRCEFA